MSADTRVLYAMPAALKPRIRPTSVEGWYRLTAPAWGSLRPQYGTYVSRSPETAFQHWANDVCEYHGRTFPEVMYAARREYRSMQETLGRIGGSR